MRSKTLDSLDNRVIFGLRDMKVRRSCHRDSRAAGRDHQHVVDHFVIKIDADNGISARLARAFFQFVKGDIARLAEFLFISTRTPANDIGDRREKVAKDVCPKDGLADDNTVIVSDRLALDGRRGCHDHVSFSPSFISDATCP